MELSVKIAEAGNRILTVFAAILMAVMLLYGGFSLWNNWIIDHQAFGSEYLKFKPTPEDKDGLYDLMKINPDVRGWITIDNTHIDYPVVQGNYDYEYINRDVYGNFSLAGSIFMATTNDPDFKDPYTLLYGHHMAEGAMFGDIDKFLEKDFFDSNKTGTLYLPEETYKIELFACVNTDAYDEVLYSEETQTSEDIPALAASIKEKAVNWRDISLKKGDRVIALSTCASSETNGRHVLFGKIVQEDFIKQGENTDE